MEKLNQRRNFFKKVAMGGAGVLLASSTNSRLFGHTGADTSTPAILGGEKSFRGVWPEWPEWNPATDEKRLLEVIRSGVWSRSKVVREFEAEWAKAVGTKKCLSLVNGTNALIVALSQAGIGFGDEVIVPPYTFIATVQAVIAVGAIPVFVDIDPNTFHIDPAKIEAKINPKTKAIIPVHILGIPADITSIMAIGKKHKLFVLEDACQAHLAEVNGVRVGAIGDAGCFSFQNSKNVPMGEGGTITSNDEDFIDRCFSYHNYGYPVKAAPGQVMNMSNAVGNKLRLSEYQAAIGLAMMVRMDKQTNLRWNNAEYLKSKIKTIPGITPYQLYKDTTKAVFHLFPFRYDKSKFSNMPRALFLKALAAEGVPASSGYAPLQTQLFIKAAFESKNYKAAYSAKEIDYATWMKNNQCPISDKLCEEEAVWMGQNMLLGTKEYMNSIASAIEKVQKNAAKIIAANK